MSNYDNWLVEQEHSYRGWNKKAPRTCDITGEGMWEGFVLHDTKYIKYEHDLLEELRKLDWSEEELKYDMKVSRMTDQEIVEMSYEEGVHYWTEWEIEDEFKD